MYQLSTELVLRSTVILQLAAVIQEVDMVTEKSSIYMSEDFPMQNVKAEFVCRKYGAEYLVSKRVSCGKNFSRNQHDVEVTCDFNHDPEKTEKHSRSVASCLYS